MDENKISGFLLWTGLGIGFFRLVLESLGIYEFKGLHPFEAAVIVLIGGYIFLELYNSNRYKKLRFGITFLYFVALVIFLGGAYKFFESFLELGDLVSFILLSLVTIPSVLVVIYLILESSKFIAKKISVEID